MLAAFALSSAPGNERRVMERVAQATQALKLSPQQMDRLNTAVSEAALNAIEHGNQYQASLPVEVDVAVSQSALRVTITDRGASGTYATAEAPDLQAKLAGAQSPRGWGLFLIKSMVDSMRIVESTNQHTIELMLNLDEMSQGENDADGA